MGEGVSFGPTINSFINNLLTSLGSTMPLVDATLDIGSQVAPGAQIVSDALTSGASGYN
jgi:hypothetical protein